MFWPGGATAAAASPPAATPAPPPQPPHRDPFAIDDPKKLHVYLLMGQSNMLGRDVTGIADQVPNPRIGALDGGGHWLVAVEPIAPGGTGFGPGTFFAAAMLEGDPEGKIGLVGTAVGGSPLNHWIKGAPHYETALKQARIAMKTATIEGVLWHQGESDSNDAALAESYESRLVQMFQDLRADLGIPDLPIVVGQLGTFVKGSHIEPVRAALRNLPNDLPLVGYADSAGLGHKGDSLHFNAEAQHQMGLRYAAAMLELQKKRAAGTPAP